MQDHATSRSVSVSDIEMHYVEHGTGEPVIFVHGALVGHRCWEPHIRIVGQSHRAIALDLRYCGTGDWPDDGSNFSIQTHADDLAAFIRSLAKEPVTLVGWSYGGTISLVTAAQNPDLIGGMFLYEPALATFLTEPADMKAASDDRAAMFRDAMGLVAIGDLAAAARAGIDGVNNVSGLFDCLPSRTRSMILENARTMPLIAAAPPPPAVVAEDLRTLDIPVAILVGGETREFYKIVACSAVRLLPSAELQTIDGAIHLWPVEDPDAFSHCLLDFIAKH